MKRTSTVLVALARTSRCIRTYHRCAGRSTQGDQKKNHGVDQGDLGALAICDPANLLLRNYTVPIPGNQISSGCHSVTVKTSLLVAVPP